MVAIDLKGLKKVTRKLASGKTEVYWYAWLGGPRLEGKKGTPEFVSSYNRAVEGRRAVPDKSVKGLIAIYKGSGDYKGLSKASKRAYDSYIKLIENEFGDMKLAAFDDRRTRGIFKGWRDDMSDTPRKADYAWTVLAKICAFGADRGLCANPCMRGGRLYDVDRTEIIWTEDHLSKLFAVASKEVRAVVIMALWTGQRQGDVLTMPWSTYDGRMIKVKQSKTRARVAIPAPEELRSLLDTLPKHATTILASSEKTSWTSSGFRASFRTACKKAKLQDVRFNDLRGTAVTRLAIAGCTTLEIASITGHSEKDVSAILERHYLGGRAQLAENAILKLETRTKLGKRQENAGKE